MMGIGGDGIRRGGAALALSGLLALAASPAPAAEGETLAEVLEILHQEGMIDEERHAALAGRLAEERAQRSWLDRISLWGDFRARYENFLFERAGGERRSDRHRGRYRARLNLRGEVNDYASVYLRLASGSDDARSTNQTLGSGVDFDTDLLRLDLAYLTLTPTPDGGLCCIDDGYLAVDFGKLKNPFVWKSMGMDSLVWDNDITPEGIALRLRGSAGPAHLFAHGGYFIIDENDDGFSKDPQLAAGQIGGRFDLGEGVVFGARGTLYHYFSLDDDFFTGAGSASDRGIEGGNLAGGLAARNDGPIQVVETAAFLDFDCSELFPVLLFGSYAHNLSARSTPEASRNDDAYSAGLFVGDKKQLVRFGFAYVSIQANALPSQFIDSDLTDGKTNRQGYSWTLSRQLLDNLELSYQVLMLKRLRGGAAFFNSIGGSDRVRMRLDLNLKF